MSEKAVRRLDRLAASYAAKAAVHDLSLSVAQPSTGLSWSWGRARQPIQVASITKLFTTALVMKLCSEGSLSLSGPVVHVLGEEVMRGLVVVGGVDHGAAVTVRHLLAHTSGIPDYYSLRGGASPTVAEEMRASDRHWSFEELVARARALRSPFPPRDHGPAHYSDTNFQLLGRLVETVTGEDLVSSVRRELLTPLGLDDTWHVTADRVGRHGTASVVYEGRVPLRAPATLASMPAEGGLISTTADLVRFLQAFMTGGLFPRACLTEMTATWNRLTPAMGPLRHGIGLMRFALPRWQTAGMSMPPLVGHSGSFGSVLYHAPDTDLYVAGTVNQTTPQSLPYPLLARVALATR